MQHVWNKLHDPWTWTVSESKTVTQCWLSTVQVVLYFGLKFPLYLSAREQNECRYLRPADDFAVGFELRAVEDLDAGDGLHRLPIDRTDDTE